MKKLILVIAALAFSAQPALAGDSAEARRQKLEQAKQEKSAAITTHQLEAELMKDVKRSAPSDKPAPASKPSKLAAHN